MKITILVITFAFNLLFIPLASFASFAVQGVDLEFVVDFSSRFFPSGTNT
jgi:hypothetical protein